jgi:hypothetical protein
MRNLDALTLAGGAGMPQTGEGSHGGMEPSVVFGLKPGQ